MAPFFDHFNKPKSVTLASLALLSQPVSTQNDLVDSILKKTHSQTVSQQTHTLKKLILTPADQSNFLLAAHRSHRSHRSHSSHRSHYSSRGGISRSYNIPTVRTPTFRSNVRRSQSRNSKIESSKKHEQPIKTEIDQHRDTRIPHTLEANEQRKRTAPPKKPENRPVHAASKLSMAKALLKRGRPSANKRLKEIVKAYPETSAALEARQLLGIAKDLLEMRIWIASKGKIRIKARFISFDYKVVQLLKENRDMISIPIQDLSKKDQQVVRTISSFTNDD